MAASDKFDSDSNPLARLLGAPRSQTSSLYTASVQKPLSTRVASQFHQAAQQTVPARSAAKPQPGRAEVSRAAMAAAPSMLRDIPMDGEEVVGVSIDGPVLDLVDLDQVNPGPAAADVPFGSNCGSCAKFLALNDPRRDDPDFMDRYLSGHMKCPSSLPELILMKYKGRTVDEVVMRADTPACTKFVYEPTRASKDLVEVMNRLAHLQRGELEVVAVSMDSLRHMKKVEARFGYRIGQVIPVHIHGRSDITGKVLGIDVGKRKLLLEVVLDGAPRKVTMKIPEALEID